MTNSFESEPWRGLPAGFADEIEPALDEVTEEILAAIAREVPEYARPLEGRFGRGIRTGVGEALSQFVSLIRDPDAGRELGREVYVALGRGEAEQGRTLDSLQAAYRVGARLAWRHFARLGREAGLDAETQGLLAEAVFAYIDELAADSVEGYAAAQTKSEEIRARRRRELAALLMQEPAAEPADLAAAARAAGWKLPGLLAPLVCGEDDLADIARRLPVDVLATTLDEAGCLLIPDPAGPGRPKQIAAAARKAPSVLGGACDPAGAGDSWRIARAGLRAVAAGAIAAKGLIAAEDHLLDLTLLEAGPPAKRLTARRLARFDQLTPAARTRMEATALSFLRRRGNAVEMAEELHVHPQTARYRLARLRELLGDDLDDPDHRFELEIALRSTPP